MAVNRDQHRSILSLVSASPDAAMRKDKVRWLSLFADDAWIEDPAGTRRYFAGDSSRSLSAFYDIFIRESDLTIEIEDDFVSGNDVLRDGVIAIAMPQGASIRIPAFLRYEVSETGQIAGLRAHWQITSAVWLALRSGGAGYLADLARRFRSAAGIRGLGSLLTTTGMTPWIGRFTAHRLKTYLDTGRFFEATLLFGSLDDGAIRVRTGAGTTTLPPNYLTTGEFRLLDVSKTVAAGRFVACRFTLLLEGRTRSGVGIITLAWPGLRIQSFEIFL
jgi:hypothetical protein